MDNQQEIRVGIKIDIGKGPQLFGAEEVNRLITAGWQVTELRQGGVIFAKQEEAGRPIQLIVSGCDMIVKMKMDAPKNSGPA